jgi:hypothetical protein
MNKKGGIEILGGNITVFITFFALVVMFIFLLVFWNIASNIDALFSATTQGVVIKANTQKAFDTFDMTLMFVYFALHLGLLIGAVLMRGSPLLYIIMFLIIIIVPLVAAPIANAYEDIKNDNTLTTAADNLTMTNYIMTRLPYFEVIWSIITGVLLIGLAKYEGVL